MKLIRKDCPTQVATIQSTSLSPRDAHGRGAHEARGIVDPRGEGEVQEIRVQIPLEHAGVSRRHHHPGLEKRWDIQVVVDRIVVARLPVDEVVALGRTVDEIKRLGLGLDLSSL
jgi:hypothetical protein